MIFRFWYEFVFGVITLVSVIIFGPRGIIAMVPIAFLPIITRVKKIKADEREKQLFFKSTQFLINVFIILILFGVFIIGVKIEDLASLNRNLLPISAAIFMIVVSTIRLFFYYKH